jgi:hypothetical protein
MAGDGVGAPGEQAAGSRREIKFEDGPLQGSTLTILPGCAVEGTEGWYPAAADSSASTPGTRYVLRVAEDGTKSFKRSASRIRLINREDITIGLGVMQSVYAIALVIGFTRALEPSYPAIVHPFLEPPRQLGHPVLLLALSTLMLLGVRFFWVTRSLYALVIIDHATAEDEIKKRVGALMRVHFPVTLLHALLFFVLCDTYVALIHATPQTALPRVDRFISLTIALLLLNASWLLVTFYKQPLPSQATKYGDLPAIKWGRYNTVFAVMALIWRISYDSVDPTTTVVLLVASLIIVANSFWDLLKTARFYILFPGDPLPR